MAEREGLSASVKQFSSQRSPNLPLLVVVQTWSVESHSTTKSPAGEHSSLSWQAAPDAWVPRYAARHVADIPLPQARGFDCRALKQATAEELSKVMFGFGSRAKDVSTNWQLAALYW
jgi:hypothetical protein